MTADTLLSRFAETSCGLLYRSETDVEYTPFLWSEMTGSPSAKEIAVRDHLVSGEPVEVETLAFFFRHVEPEERERYDKLIALLTELLADPIVLKLGRIRKKCYILGKVKDGTGWAGLKTEAVET